MSGEASGEPSSGTSSRPRLRPLRVLVELAAILVFTLVAAAVSYVAVLVLGLPTVVAFAVAALVPLALLGRGIARGYWAWRTAALGFIALAGVGVGGILLVYYWFWASINAHP